MMQTDSSAAVVQAYWKLCDAVNYFFFFLLLFQATGLFCEYDPLCGTLVAVIKFVLFF